MNVRPRGLRETAEKILQQFRLHAANELRGQFPFTDQVRPAAEVDGGGRQSFVHRHQEISRAQNAALRAKSFFDRFAKNDACVFDGVVLVHIEVSARGEFQIHRAVPRHKRQHVIEKWNPGRDFRTPAAVEVQAHGDVGFRCGAAQLCFSHRHNFSKSLTLSMTARAPNLRSVAARCRCASLPRGSTPKNGTRALRAASASSILSPR